MVFRWKCNKYSAEELKNRLIQFQTEGYLVVKCNESYVTVQKCNPKPYGLAIRPNIETFKDGTCIGCVGPWLIQYVDIPGVVIKDLDRLRTAKTEAQRRTILYAVGPLFLEAYVAISIFRSAVLWEIFLCCAALAIIILLCGWRVYRIQRAAP